VRREGLTPGRGTLGGVADLHDELRTFWNEDARTYDRSPSHALTDLGAALRRASRRREAQELLRRALDLAAGGADVAISYRSSAHAAEATRADLERRLREAQKRIEKLEEQLRNAQLKGGDGVQARTRQARVPLTTASVEAESMDDLRAFADRLLEKQGGLGVVAVTTADSYVVKTAAAEVDAKLIRDAFGPGGGPPHLTQGKLARNAEEAFDALEKALQ